MRACEGVRAVLLVCVASVVVVCVCHAASARASSSPSAAAAAAAAASRVLASPSLSSSSSSSSSSVSVSRAPFWITGIVAAVPTPFFASNLSLALDRVDVQAASLAANGVRYAFVCGTTGESMSMTVDERKRVAERWRVACDTYGLSLIVHVGTSTPAETVDLARHAAAIGADAIAAMAPSFFRPTTVQQLVQLLDQVSKAAPSLPLYYYHMPDLTGVDLPVADIIEYAAESGLAPTLNGIKFTDYNLFELGRAIDNYGARANILFGRDEVLMTALALGAEGGVGSTYNLPFAMPVYKAMQAALAGGNVAEARKQQLRALELVQLLHVYGSGAVKGMMTLAGVDVGVPRPPAAALTAEQLAALRDDLKRLGFLN